MKYFAKNGLEVIDEMKRRGVTEVMLAFSGGKDSVACWLAIRDHFKVIPFYRYLVPDLEFVNDTIHYYEDYFKQEVLMVPHPSLYRMIDSLVFYPPERKPIIEKARLYVFDYMEQRKLILRDLGKPLDTWGAIGIRRSDSLNRRRMFQVHGEIHERQRNFYPIFDMNKDGLVAFLKEKKVKVSIDYELFGRSFDGLDFRFVYQVKNKFPNDYKKIIEWFPLVELEFKRYEYSQRR